MFRILILLFCFSILLATALGAYQSVNQLNIQACNDVTACYTQIASVFNQATLSIHDIVTMAHDMNRFAVIFLFAGVLIASLFLQGSRVKTVLITLFLGVIIATQVALEVHSEWLLTKTLNQAVQYLLSGLALFVGFYLFIQANKYTWVQRSEHTRQWLVCSSIFLLSLQILLGAWLNANNAGLLCGDFPRCLGSWWPQVDYQNAFNFLGSLSFSAKLALEWQHRVFSVVIFLSLTWLMLRATTTRIKQVRWAGVSISFLLLLQIASGIVVVKLAMPVWAAVLHNVVALLLMLPLIAIGFYTKYRQFDAALDQAKTLEAEALVATVVSDEVVAPVSVEQTEPESLYLRLKSQLGKTRIGLGSALSVVSLRHRKIDQDLLEEIETSLLMADVGMEVTTDIIATLEESVEKHQLQDGAALSALLKQQLLTLLAPVSQPLVIPEKEGPYVILVVGVNGVGKTTTIGKLAQRLQQQGHSVMLAAGDTFRAAAVEQLQAWGERNSIHVVAQHTGADSASVIFDGVQSAKAKGVDVLIADTAGRLHTKSNLMEELKKIKRIIQKLDETAPHEVLLVLDAGTGQNALSQAEHFNKSVELTGLALTKLDGTAKGGMIFALAKQMGLPIRFLGVGEGINDLQDFNAEQFIDALFMVDEQ